MFKQPASISILLEEASKAHCDELENCFPEGQDTNSVKVSAPANFQHFILALKSFYSKFRWCNMQIWFSFSHIPSHLEKIYSFQLLREKTAGDTRRAIWLSFSASISIDVLNKFTHCLDSLTTNSRCMSNLIFLASFKLWWLILHASSQNT